MWIMNYILIVQVYMVSDQILENNHYTYLFNIWKSECLMMNI